MLTLDIARICADKGISEPSIFLRRLRFNSNYITAILRRKPTVRLSNRQIETLCLALHCTPTELFTWQPDEGRIVPAAHPLHARLPKQESSITADIRELSPKQLEDLRAYLEALKQQ